MNMIERVSRAICIAQKYDPDAVWAMNDAAEGAAPGAPRGDVAIRAYLQTRFISAARAAIEAMREPTEAMLLSGRIAGEWRADSDGETMDGNADDVWNAMIDAVLQEKQAAKGRDENPSDRKLRYYVSTFQSRRT